MKQATYHIADMCCPTEEQIVRNRLKSVAGITRLDFNLMERSLTVTHEMEDERPVTDALASLRMGARRTGADGGAAEAGAEEPATDRGKLWERIAIGASGVLAAAAEVAAWTTHAETSPVVVGLAVLSIVLGGRETLSKGITALRTFTLNINFLMSVAVIGAVAIGQWPEAAMVTFLFAVAEMVEGYSMDRARNAIRALMEVTPETAEVSDGDGGWSVVPAAEVALDQVVRVRPGARVPLDGVVLSGASTVNQAPITGESMPVEKAAGDTVFAGTINERGAFEFRVTANRGDTTLARIVRAVQEAQSERAPTQRFVDRFALYYTPAVCLLALAVAVAPPLLFQAPFQPWLYKALVLLVIACPCALVISTPVTVVSGLAAAARRGILVKGGAYLEGGRGLKVVALDKTGTLTHGKPAVTDIVPLGRESADSLLQVAASLDAHSEHPVAAAIVARWTGNGGRAAGTEAGSLLPVAGFESVTGRGARGKVGDRPYFIGNHRLAEENGVCSPAMEGILGRLESEGKTAVVLGTDEAALAVFGVADTLREASIEAVRELHALGVRTAILTGDNQATARAIADSVGIDDARGNLLPEDKMAAVTALEEKYGPLGMVGDGVNDAPALARANIGFAMGAAGSDTALETADVALMEDDLRKLPDFLRLSRRANRILVQNISLAIGIKVVFFALALMGMATLWMAVFADMGASLLVTFNGLRLLGAEGPPKA